MPVSDYVDHIVRSVWPGLRSRQALLQTPKRHFCDVSLAAALIGANVDHLLSDLDTLGYFFESLVTHELTVFAQHSRKSVHFYRDAKGCNEMDAVIVDRRGEWVGCEVKLSHRKVDDAAASLIRAAATIQRPPRNLCVIIPSGFAYRRPDGILVLPLGLLNE